MVNVMQESNEGEKKNPSIDCVIGLEDINLNENLSMESYRHIFKKKNE